MADQKAMKKRLKALMNRPENQVCSDCPERQPRWASLIVPPPGAPAGSLPIGAFCCLECSGSHRRLGVHISFVRSINLDSWKEKEVLAMENGGNAKVNAIFEANLGHSGARKPSNHADGPTRERFIRDKYERRKFYDPNAFSSLPEPSAAAPARQQRQQQAVGPPSDAARQRMEERRARVKRTNSGSSTGSGPGRSGGAGRGQLRRQKSGDSTRAMSTRRIKSSAPGGESSAPQQRVKAAPVSAPPPSMDLLDLSSDPAPAPGGGGLSQPQQQQQQQKAPGHDIFNFMVVDPNATSNGQQQQQQQAKKPASQDIMSLYNNNTSQAMAHMSPGMSPMQTGFVNNGAMPQQQVQFNNQQMAQMTNMMGNMNFSPQRQPRQITPQQQQMLLLQQQQQQMLLMQQQQMMMMQQQRGRGGGGGSGGMPNAMNGGGGGGMNSGGGMMMMGMPNMMQQPQQGGFGSGGGGMPMSNFQPQQQNRQSSSSNKKKPQQQKEDPFAQFGHNAFRS